VLLARKAFSPAQQWGGFLRTPRSVLGLALCTIDTPISVLGHPSLFYSFSSWVVFPYMTVLDNLAGHLSYDLVGWFFEHGVMPLYTPVGGSWLNMAESVQRMIVPRALAGQHPQHAQQIIDWLEQTVEGWNNHSTPFVWNGKRRRRRERAHLRRLAGSGAAIRICKSFAR
jgi:hypothetical protein